MWITASEWIKKIDYNRDKPANTTKPITLFILLSKATAASEKAETPGIVEEEQLVMFLVSWVRCDWVTVEVVTLDETEKEEERVLIVDVEEEIEVEEDFL